MPIKETFIIETTPGIEPISWNIWFKNLPLSEKQRYHQARARADAYRQEAIDAGLMSIEPGTGNYIWRDEQAKQQGKRQDDECLDFYTRFNADTGRQVNGVLKEI
jgi:hypothetical protein